MPSHFLISEARHAGQFVELTAERSHYLCKVMRKRAGDAFPCFSDQARGYIARIAEASTKRAVVVIEEALPDLPLPAWELHVALAMLKGQAQDRALQQATELGAASIHLVDATRSNVSLDAKRLAGKLDHWHKVVVGACEQCGRRTIPRVHPPQTTAQVLASTTHLAPMLLNPGAARLSGGLEARNWLLLIGAEGGWDDQELDSIRAAGALEVSLVDHTLRAETVPAVALALVQFAIESR